AAPRPCPLQARDVSGVIEARLDLRVLQRAVDGRLVDRARGRDDRIGEGVAGSGLIGGEAAFARLHEQGVLCGLGEGAGRSDLQLAYMPGDNETAEVARGRISRRALSVAVRRGRQRLTAGRVRGED